MAEGREGGEAGLALKPLYEGANLIHDGRALQA